MKFESLNWQLSDGSFRSSNFICHELTFVPSLVLPCPTLFSFVHTDLQLVWFFKVCTGPLCSTRFSPIVQGLCDPLSLLSAGSFDVSVQLLCAAAWCSFFPSGWCVGNAPFLTYSQELTVSGQSEATINLTAGCS